MGIRQQPITTENEFMDALKEANFNEETLFVQWRPDLVKEYEPEVVLVENFVWVQTNPNDAWWYIENNQVRAWKLFPNEEERDLPWPLLNN